MKGGTRSYEMALRMVASGHEVHMVTSLRDDSLKNKDWLETNVDGIHVHWLPVKYDNRMSYAERIRAFFKFALKASKKACSIGGDVIFATSTPLTIAIPAVKAKKKLGIPLVFEVRDLWPELPIAIGAIKSPSAKWLATKLENYAYFNSDHVIGLSPGMTEGVIKAGYPKNKTSTIPNSCDLDMFNLEKNAGQEFRNRFDWLQNRPLILYAGTLGHINGVSYLVELASQMCDVNSEVRFLVLGAGVEECEIREQAKELGVLDKNFFMLEQVNKSQIPSVFKAATVSTSLFVDMPEMWANSANKFFDTLASGTPVLINYGGWQKDIIEREDIGITLPPAPTREAAERLNCLLCDKERLKRLGDNARAIAERDFSRDKLARELIQVLEDVVSQ